MSERLRGEIQTTTSSQNCRQMELLHSLPTRLSLSLYVFNCLSVIFSFSLSLFVPSSFCHITQLMMIIMYV